MSTIPITVRFIDSNGRKLRTLDSNVDPQQPIGALKTNLGQKFGEDIQCIKFNEKELNDDMNCRSYGIQSGSELFVICNKEGQNITLNVDVASRNSNLRPFNVKVDPNATTEQLVDEITNKIPFNANAADLSCRGRQLTSGTSLGNQGIRNNHQITATVRERGG